MDALPANVPPDGIETFTSLVCPDCRGAVRIQNHKGHAMFTCRVGHSYSTDELIAGKEAALEVRLWEAVYAFEEMAVLLTDLDRHHLVDGVDPAAARERAALAQEQAARLRAVVQADRPVAAAHPGRTAGPAVSS